MDDYERSRSLWVLVRNGNFPDSQKIHLDRMDPRSITVTALFFQLGTDEIKLREIYEWGIQPDYGAKKERWEDRLAFTGNYTSDGMQRLTNILDKEITFERFSKTFNVDTKPFTLRPKK